MKIIILKNNLKAALDVSGKVISKNSNLPILLNILIKTSDSKIKVLSTNLEIGITYIVSGRVIEDGSITVPYDIFYNIISNISDERINLEGKNNTLVIKTDNYEATIQGSSESEFPIIPKIERSTSIEINQEEIKSALDKVILAAGISDLRPEINGVFFAIENSAIKLVATDSFRLAEARIEKNKFKTNSGEVRFIVPLKAAQVFSRVMVAEETATFYLDNGQIMAKAGNIEVVSRLVDGKFPDYEAIVPKTIDTETTLKRSELVNALRLASSFAAKAREVGAWIKDKRIIEIYSSDASIGDNKYIIPVKSSGPDVQINFNLNYLLDGIQTEDSEDVYIGFNWDSKPVLIKTPGSGSYFYILMPIRS